MVVRELINRIGFKIDDKQLKKTQSKVGKFKDRLKKIGAVTAGISAAITGVAIATFKLAESIAKTGDAIAKTARDIGISGEALQEWRFAADLAGIDTQKFDNNLLRFTKRLGEVATLGKGPAKKAFEQLGITLKEADGSIRPVDDILVELSNRFRDIKDPAERSALAFELFGREGQRMATFLAQGSEEISKMRKEARDLGFVLSNETQKDAEDFVDAMTRMRAAIKGIMFKLGAEIIPIAKNIIDFLTDLFKNELGALLKNVINLIRPILKSVFEIIKQLIGVLVPILQTVFNLVIPLVSRLLDAVIQIITPLLKLVNAVLKPLLEIINALIPPILELVDIIVSLLADLISDSLDDLIVVFEDLGAIISDVLSLVMPLLRPILKASFMFLKIWLKLKLVSQTFLFKILIKGLQKVMGLIRPLVAMLTDLLLPAFEKVEAFFDSFGKKLQETFMAAVEGTIKIIKDTIGSLQKTIIALVTGILTNVNKIINVINEFIAFVDTIPFMKNVIKPFETLNVDGIINKLTNLIPQGRKLDTRIDVKNNINITNEGPKSPRENMTKTSINQAARSSFGIELKNVLVEAGL